MTGGGKGIKGKIITSLSVILMITGILYVANILDIFTAQFTMVPYCALMLMLVLILVFLIFPARKGGPKETVRWYDFIFITMSICGTGYLAFFPNLWEPLLLRGTTTLLEVVLCFMLVVAIVEATRRTVNLSMAIISAFFVVHLVFGAHFPSILRTFDFSLERIASIFYLRAEGIFGVPVEIAFTIVLVFMIFSSILQMSKAGQIILDLAFGLTGRWRGGPAKASIIGSAALGSMVGATTANIVTTGSITIPLMKKTGYHPDFAGAVECVASNGGQIMPPVMGAVAFLIAEMLSIPYWFVCVAAFLPAVLYFLATFVQVHFEAVRLGLKGIPPSELPSLINVIKSGWYYMLPVVLLVYTLAVLELPIQHCGLLASAAALIIVILDWQRKKESRKSFSELIMWAVQFMETGSRALIVPAVACASAGIIIGSLEASGLGFRLSSILVDASGGNLFVLLLLTAISSFILGMGMTSIPCYLVLVILVAPALVQLGVEPIAAHLFVFYYGLISFLTPPVAIAAYVACGISHGHPMRTGYIAMRLGVVKYIIPFLFVYNPALLWIGPGGIIALTIISGILGTILLSIGLEGYFIKRLTLIERILLVVGGFFLLLPVQHLWGLIITGIVLSFIAIYWHARSTRKVSVIA